MVESAARSPAQAPSAVASDTGASNPGASNSVTSDLGAQGDFDVSKWRRRMAQTDIAAELFLPVQNADWRKDRLRVRRREKSEARTRITGVRLNEADPAGENLEPERATQTDFRRLVDSLIKLRSLPGGGDLVLSGDTFRASPRFEMGARRRVPRYRFGLRRGHERMVNDHAAARASHARIRSLIRWAGFVVVTPEERFDPDTGLAGLRDWVDRLRLRRRRRIWPWLLPLLLLPLLLQRCDPVETFFGVPIETNSLVLIVDRSSSMQSHFAALRDEAKKVLSRMRNHGTGWADVIAYDSKAQSRLGGIGKLDEATAAKLDRFLDGLQAGGGTNLSSGIEMAAREVAKHERPTTLVILTDARDGSIAPMVKKGKKLLEPFSGVDVVGHALTPRLFGTNENPQPIDGPERALSELAENLNGHFGAAGTVDNKQKSQ